MKNKYEKLAKICACTLGLGSLFLFICCMSMSEIWNLGLSFLFTDFMSMSEMWNISENIRDLIRIISGICSVIFFVIAIIIFILMHERPKK